MRDAYTDAFYGVVKETQEQHGYELPVDLESYVVMLLAHYIDRPNFAPHTSFAEAYMSLKQPANMDAKQLGDACLIVAGVFPTYGSRKGLSRSYYQNIGIGSYEMVAEVMNRSLFKQLAHHFNFLSDFIDIAISQRLTKDTHYNLFR